MKVAEYMDFVSSTCSLATELSIF